MTVLPGVPRGAHEPRHVGAVEDVVDVDDQAAVDVVAAADGAQLALYGRAPTQAPAGRCELLVKSSVDAANLDARDHGAACVAVELARALDHAARRADVWAAAAVARELREQLTRLQLDPLSRDGASAGGDAWKAFTDDLGTPTT